MESHFFLMYGHLHAEDTGTAANIQDNLVLEEVAVLVDGVAVRAGTDIVFLYAEDCKLDHWIVELA